MHLPTLKRIAGVFRKTLAIAVVAVIAFFSLGLTSFADAAQVSGVRYELYNDYDGAASVRPWLDPSVVSNYNLCKTGTFSNINFPWDGGDVEGCGATNLLIHYHGFLKSSTAQTLYFRGISDDGFWAKVGNTKVVDNWVIQGCIPSGTGSPVTFSAGEYKELDIWFFQGGWGSCSKFFYSTSPNGTYSPVPASMFTTTDYQAVDFSDLSVTDQIPAGSPYSSAVTADASGTVTYSVLDGNLPPGISLNPSTGSLTGSSNNPGSYNFRVRASATDEGVGSTAYSDWINITVGSAVTGGGGLESRTLNTGSFFTDRAVFGGFPVPTVVKASGSLPPGVTLSASGTLSGTPTTTGTYTFTLRGSNFVSSVTTAEYTYTVQSLPTPVETNLLQQLLVGSNYQDGIEYSSYPAPTYSISEGALPPGLLLGNANGMIAGIPTVGGVYNFRIRVTSGQNNVTTGNYALTVRQAPTKVDVTIVDTVESGSAYTDGVSASGFPAPTYSVVAGTLPVGLKLNPITGAITGIPTATGLLNFTIEAKNTVGTLAIPLSLKVQSLPVFIGGELPPTLNLGQVVNAKMTASGFPLPTFSVASGALPDGVTLDPITGEISGTATNGGTFTFVVAATNDVGSANYQPITVQVIGVKSEIALSAQIGDVVTGKTISVSGEGLKPQAPYEVVLRSTPQTIASGKISSAGSVEEQTKIPSGLEPGWHSITLTSSNADGTNFEKAIYFQVTETLMLEEISEVAPTDAQKSEALTNDPEFYARMGIDPAGTVTPAAVAQQVQQVTSVVASVALVSAAAAGAAAAASAAGGAASGASSAGGARVGGTSSSSSSSSSSSRGGGTSSSSSSSSSSGGDGSSDSDSDSADYGNIEAEHDDFETESVGPIDRLGIWRFRLFTALDRPLTRWIESTAKVSPVLSRVLNDGSYLRAIFGSVVALGYFSAVPLGVAAVDTGAASLAASGRVGFLVLIIALGTLDALFGILAMTAFVTTSLVVMPVAGIGDYRYLLAMFILGFAPSIMATTFRKIRRPAIENLSDAWERVIDLALIGFISVLTVMSLVGSVSAFAGATVPLSADVKPIALAIACVAVGRVVIEEFAAKLAPERLNRINPTEVPETYAWQPWASLVLKFATLILMIGGMVGMGWHLWVGALLIFLPGIIGMIFPSLPSVRWIHELIPGGIGALAFATLISSWSGQLVNSLLGNSPLYGQLSFILIPLPVILISIIGMFAKQEDKLWQRVGKKWIGIIGGIAVFAFTVQVTNFIPTIFG